MPVAAIAGKRGNDVSKQLIDMLSSMRYNKRLFSIATDNEVVTTKDLESINLVKTRRAIGHIGFWSRDGRFSAKLTTKENTKLFLALDGYILNYLRPPYEKMELSDDFHNLIDLKTGVSNNLFETVKSILPTLRGAFAFVVMGESEIVVVRDLFGFKPLYWGEDREQIAIASERKALWKIGLKDVTSFPPGFVAAVDGIKKNVTQVLSLAKPQIIDFEMANASKRLSEVIEKAIFRDFGGIEKVSLLFSGGVDSSLIAKVFCDMGLKVRLYGVAVEESYDAKAIAKSASKLGCKLHMRILSLEEIENYLYKTIYAIEEANLMKVGVGIPLYAALETINNHGTRFVSSGQGGDELFGGYSRYSRVMRGGYNKVYEELWKDLIHISEVNLQRDGAIATANNVDLFFPFLDTEIVNLSNSLPAELKIKGPGDTLRKHVLRETAKIFGLPDSIVNMPKKAAQYSSGSDKAIRRLAISKKKRPNEYIKSVFEEVFKEYCAS